ncbi:hypothetical protein EBA29_01377 [Bacillus velezensis]|jgi:hypothetical protein|uniref:Uncharacterized protein n=1 Tax=Bacillus amyloliquefaciens (strain Y2) TaxID=1155777 RepID=I2C465_BACAY|nr:hypothetical protein MUS_1426 [Bacillus velezensis YAU B9601-Y2]AHZ15301.1 hypothetical protein V529_12750 [Bacillus velezensis SQR9]EIF12888.1 hypothetical protein MY7_1212 [Bacillus sp. 5B6]QAR56409.1 hypothetical protein EBA29_01377 [Bacillus velezensis]RAP15427.1 hypothetical protein HS9_00755 [Bacillus velezensis]
MCFRILVSNGTVLIMLAIVVQQKNPGADTGAKKRYEL